VAQHAAGEVALPAASAICGINSGFFTAWHSGCTNPWKLACTEGNSGTIPFDPVSTSNGCSTRVWIYQEAVRAGYNLCLNPDSSTGALDKAYTYVWISGNAEDC